MGRKTLILTENQFNEICGANMAYLDNKNDYAEDGTVHMRTDGAVDDSDGGKYYSKPPTTSDIAHTMSPETLWSVLFRNGGHGLWGHWGSGLRADTMDGFDRFKDEFDFDDDFEDEEDDVKKKLQESNSELEGRYWMLDLDDSGVKKKYSYTYLTTLKTVISQGLEQLIQQKAPRQQIEREQRVLDKICSVLNRETGTIKQRKTNLKNLGFENQFQKAGGTKNNGGKAHSKKVKDPNVGTGYITYT